MIAGAVTELNETQGHTLGELISANSAMKVQRCFHGFP